MDPKQVADLHKRADTDSSFKAIHHTLGKKHNQAAPGDHTHDGIDSSAIETGIQTIEPGSDNVHVDITDGTATISVDESSGSGTFITNDGITAVLVDNDPVEITCTYTPVALSVIVFHNGLQEYNYTGEIVVVGKVITITPSIFIITRSSDLFWVAYRTNDEVV